LSVGLPLDVQVYEADSLKSTDQIRIETDDVYFQSISEGWGEALRNTLAKLPSYSLTS
jgi:putative proteasome-type protease